MTFVHSAIAPLTAALVLHTQASCVTRCAWKHISRHRSVIQGSLTMHTHGSCLLGLTSFVFSCCSVRYRSLRTTAFALHSQVSRLRGNREPCPPTAPCSKYKGTKTNTVRYAHIGASHSYALTRGVSNLNKEKIK